MWRSILSCVVLGGCGFESQPLVSDARAASPAPMLDARAPPGAADAMIGAGADAATDAGRPAADAVVDALAPPNCLARWFESDVPLRPPLLLATVSSAGNYRDPWVSPDEKTLYFARDTPRMAT